MRRYYWSGISTDERTKAISEITAIVGRYTTVINWYEPQGKPWTLNSPDPPRVLGVGSEGIKPYLLVR